MDETTAIDRPRRPLRKWLLAVGVLCLAMALTFVVLAVAPLGGSFEPAWLRDAPTIVDHHGTSATVYYMPGGRWRKGEERTSGDRLQMLRMPFDEFVRRMNADLKASDGWKFTRSNSSVSANWTKSNGTDYFDFWAMEEKGQVRVSTSYIRQLSWGEKARQWMKRTLGF